MTKSINAIARAAHNELTDRYFPSFTALYTSSEIQTLKSRTILKYSRKYSVLNEADIEATFDDALMDAVRTYTSEQSDFLAYLQRAVSLRILDRVRAEMTDRRRTIHEAHAEVVEESDEERADGSYHIAPSPLNTEHEAILNVMCEQMDATDAALVRAIADGKVVSLSECAEYAGYRNRQQAHRAVARIRSMIA